MHIYHHLTQEDVYWSNELWLTFLCIFLFQMGRYIPIVIMLSLTQDGIRMTIYLVSCVFSKICIKLSSRSVSKSASRNTVYFCFKLLFANQNCMKFKFVDVKVCAPETGRTEACIFPSSLYIIDVLLLFMVQDVWDIFTGLLIPVFILPADTTKLRASKIVPSRWSIVNSPTSSWK